MLADEAAQRFSGLAVIGDGYSRLEESGQHLPPTVVRFAGMIGGRGIAGDENGRHVVGLLDLDPAHGRARAGEFERDAVVPSPGFRSFFTILETDLAAGGDFRRA